MVMCVLWGALCVMYDYQCEICMCCVFLIPHTPHTSHITHPPNTKQVSDVYRKLRFTVRFLLGNVSDFDPVNDSVNFDQLPAVDQYMLGRLASLVEEVTSAYEQYQFYKVYQVRVCVGGCFMHV